MLYRCKYDAIAPDGDVERTGAVADNIRRGIALFANDCDRRGAGKRLVLDDTRHDARCIHINGGIKHGQLFEAVKQRPQNRSYL